MSIEQGTVAAVVPRVVVVLGAGEIGSGWAALFAAYGAEVRVVDPAPTALDRAHESLLIARSLLARRAPRRAPPHHPLADVYPAQSKHAPTENVLATRPGRITAAPLDEAVEGAGWIQESLPERIDLKRAALKGLERLSTHEAIIASSTATLTASIIAEGFSFAHRLLVVHPLHPVYAVPIVEISAGRHTDSETVDRAAEVLRALGREPVIIRGEPPGLVANRLTAALLREALDLVANGVISPASVDRIVARGIATGWAATGPFATEMIRRRGAASAATSERAWAELLARILDAANVRLTPDVPWPEMQFPRADLP